MYLFEWRTRLAKTSDETTFVAPVLMGKKSMMAYLEHFECIDECIVGLKPGICCRRVKEDRLL